MDKLKLQTPDLVAANVEKIAELFPNCVTETRGADGKPRKAINFEMLKQMLSDYVLEGDEAYEFTWVGKKASIVEANRPIRKTLRPCPEESKDWDTTRNLYIEGDNLEVLKLLQESYLGKVKMIYIDPPYNTGNDFIYRDNFAMGREEWSEESGEWSEDGERMFRNTESNGRFHSDWCSMMYSRLLLARNLLADDGVIFISIDDNESAQLRKICDEIFGAGNFVAQLAVQLNPRGRNLDLYVAKTHESVFIYVINYLNTDSIAGVEKEGTMIDEYNKSDSRGKYRAIGLRNRNQAFNPQTRPNLYFPLYVNHETKRVSTKRTTQFSDEVWPDAPDGTKTCWTWMSTKIDNENELIIAEKTGDEWRIFRKDYLLSEDGEIAKTLVKSLWIDNTINNDWGKKSIKQLFGSNVMSFPKSPDLIKKIISIGMPKEGIVMDFFSGSATTAHAVMQLNAEDGGQRQCIMVQLPEPCPEGSEAAKAGFKNICEIGKERIRRAGEKIKREMSAGETGVAGQLRQMNLSEVNPTLHTPNTTLDIGFRVFKVDDSNREDVYSAPADLKQEHLPNLISNIKEDRTDLDLLFGCLLDWGLPLSLPHTSEKISACTVHTYNNGDLIACFDKEIPESVIREIAKRKPLRAVFRDSSFADDPAKINVFEIFKHYMPESADDIRRRVKVI